MSSIHQKMNSDYVWIRHAPVEQGLKTRNHGIYFMYDRAPNRVQRLQMIYRSIGKQYDWELEKYRLGRKGVDRGNKRRGFKNLFRFIKNPYGYFYWRTVRNFPTMPKTMVVSFILLWSLSIFEMKSYSKSVDSVDHQLQLYGKNVEGSVGRMKGFHRRTSVRTPNFWDAFFRTPLNAHQIEINPTWRQNIRKQLQLTNAHNVAF